MNIFFQTLVMAYLLVPFNAYAYHHNAAKNNEQCNRKSKQMLWSAINRLRQPIVIEGTKFYFPKICVKASGGWMKFVGKGYYPEIFTLNAGSRRKIRFNQNAPAPKTPWPPHYGRGKNINIFVAYKDGSVWFDDARTRYAGEVPFPTSLLQKRHTAILNLVRRSHSEARNVKIDLVAFPQSFSEKQCECLFR